jgi:hypothetical protein
MDRYRRELERLNLGKGCIRFKRLEELPLETVERMLREIAERDEGNHGDSEDRR